MLGFALLISLGKQLYILKLHYPHYIGVVFLRGDCPTHEGSCLIGEIVLWGRCPEW